ncbi:MAG: hypothetical protein GY820_02890, partial [Gammaproteobacteria bacterium]|nr:hypothetical protein [Gammaproteobacteria bacterium]
MANPDSHVEGEEVVLISETEVEELKRFEAFCQELRYHLGTRSRHLELILIRLIMKFGVAYPASTIKEEGETLNELERLLSRNDKIRSEFNAFKSAGNFTDENTQELEMKFHKVYQEVSEFMEFHGVTNSSGSAVKCMRDNKAASFGNTPLFREISDRIDNLKRFTPQDFEAKPQTFSSLSGPSSIEVGAEIKTCTSQTLLGSERQLRENSVSPSFSAVISTRDDTAGSSLNAPNSIEIGENISTPTPQTSQRTVEQSRERWPQSNRYSQPPFQNRRGHYYDDRDWSTADRPRAALKGKGSSEYQGCFSCLSPYHLARYCTLRRQNPSYSTPNRAPHSPQYANRFGPTHIAPQPQPFRPEETGQPNEKINDFLTKMAKSNADMGRA